MSCNPFRNLGRIRVELRYFLISLGYFTRIPIPAWLNYTNKRDLHHAMRYFSLVGMCIGVYSALIYLAALHVWSKSISIGISIAVTLITTGALHEDGLADSCDAFGGGYTRDEVLKIMNDSQIGTFGALALIVIIGLKWQALVLMPPIRGALTLIAAHTCSRAMAKSFLITLNYVRAEGKAKSVTHRMRTNIYVASTMYSMPCLFLSDWPTGLTSLVVLVIIRICLARYFFLRLGGYTGDCLGFAQQIGELAIYLTSLAWTSF
ncbi:MAG: adenosylcobinamide-GDP ribazoletransferase [Burkholderia sp.]|nr:adenosylcobinamide-GDP ribazoletransferase [Burkholderia sp.]